MRGAFDPRAAIESIPRAYNFAADILDRNLAAGRASKPVYIDPRGSWTYGALAERVDRFGGVLRSLGIRREERILIALLDTIDWPTAFLGAIKAGVIPIPVNTLMTEEDYRFMLADSRAKVLVVSEPLLAKFENLIRASSGHRLGGECARSPRLRGCPDQRAAGFIYGADHTGRYMFLALHLGLDRQAEGRSACPFQFAPYRRPLRRRRARAQRE
jgi:hypothetical protein